MVVPGVSDLAYRGYTAPARANARDDVQPCRDDGNFLTFVTSGVNPISAMQTGFVFHCCACAPANSGRVAHPFAPQLLRRPPSSRYHRAHARAPPHPPRACAGGQRSTGMAFFGLTVRRVLLLHPARRTCAPHGAECVWVGRLEGGCVAAGRRAVALARGARLCASAALRFALSCAVGAARWGWHERCEAHARALRASCVSLKGAACGATACLA